MKKNTLFALWGVMFIVCAALGFIPEPEGALRPFLTGVSVLFFLPPALLLKTGNAETAALIRNLSALSLILTVVTLVLNFLGAFSAQWVGDALHALLVVVSSPMLCSGYWVLSLFLWACLLMVSRKKAR